MSNITDLEMQVEALASLLRHPGWVLMSERIKGRAEQAMSDMRNAKSSDDLLRHTYTYMALQDLPSAPRIMVEVMTAQLAAHQKK